MKCNGDTLELTILAALLILSNTYGVESSEITEITLGFFWFMEMCEIQLRPFKAFSEWQVPRR